ncbi:MAG: Hsp20/alpha crystallin family protein [Deltaproteobacteria bacterium]|nr:Hsp20/alpha crystallin family protein [Deltaproteobacteria bacterium]
MDLDKKYRFAKVAIVVLCLACVGLLVGLARSSDEKAATVPEFVPEFKDLDSFSRSLAKQLEAQRREAFRMFDRFFGDEFFRDQAKPFKEMERLHQELMERMEESFRHYFDRHWDDWFDSRFTQGGLRLERKNTGDAYVYRFTIPDAKEQKLDVEVSERWISIKGEFIQQLERKDSRGRVTARQEQRQTVAQSFSIPGDADYQRADISQKDGEIVVRIPRRATT